MNEMERIAPEILRDFGVDFEAATRAGGWTNHVWIAGDLVLRISPDRGGDRIRREAALGMRLPKAARYPEVLATGVREGHEWSVSRRVPGVNLGEAWPGMTWAERESAMRALWEIAEEIHSMDPGAFPAALPRRTWYSDLRPEKARADLAGLVERGVIKRETADALSGILVAFFDALGRAEHCLCHGDLTMENMMWSEGRIASVFDFEHAARLPAQADVYSFLRLVLGPDCEAAPGAFVETVASLAKARLKSADDARLLLGFAVLISVRHAQIWLEGGEDGPCEGWGPCRSLASLADGHGGFLGSAVRDCIGRLPK